jgi:branched-chain amino acid transport system ATP-binding protein
MELGRIVAADSCAVLSQKTDVREAYLGGHSTQGISGTSQRWKRRKTWR